MEGRMGSTGMKALLLVIRDWSPLEFPGPCVQELKTNKQTEMDRHMEKSRGRDCLIEKENMPVMVSVN